MKTATRVKKLPAAEWANAALYRLTEPLTGWDETTHEYVIVSAVVPMGTGPETRIYPAHPDGTIVDWLEMPGSYRGGLDHTKALRDAGYEVTPVNGVTVEARHLCGAHVGDRIELDYVAPHERSSRRVDGRLWLVSADATWVHLFLDSAQVDCEDPLVLSPDQEVTVTVREVHR